MTVARRHQVFLVTTTLLAAVVPLFAFIGGTPEQQRRDALSSWPASSSLVRIDGRASVNVTFRRGVSRAEQRRLLARLGAVETTTVPQLGIHVVSVPRKNARAFLTQLRAAHAVASAGADSVRRIAGDAVGDRWAYRKIGLPVSHVRFKRNVKVAILDTASTSSDPNGHGRSMADIVRAVAPRARVLQIRVLNADGYGLDSDIVRGVVAAADRHANVILMSFAGPDYSATLQRAIDYAWAKGAVVVAATGNDGTSTATYPAGDAKVIGVSATGADDRLWAKSNFGTDTFVAAPGVDVQAGPTAVTGTSAAAAITAGGAALLLGADTNATNGLVTGRLARTADRVAPREQVGHGRINLRRALRDRSKRQLVPSGAADRVRIDGGGTYKAASSATTPAQIGSSASGTTTATVTLTAAIPKNSTIILAAGENTTTTTGTWSATDSATPADTYVVDAERNTALQQRAAILRTYVPNGLANGSTITVTGPVVLGTVAVTAFYVQGVLSASPVDQTGSNGSSAGTTAWTVSTSASTGQPDFVAAVGQNGTTNRSYGSPTCTAIGARTNGMQAFYKQVSATGVQTCASTLSGNSTYGAAIVAYTVDTTSPTNSVSISTVGAGNAYMSTVTGNSGTLYYRGTAAGNFQLANAVADSGGTNSGPDSSTFPTLGGTTAGWSHTAPATVTTPDGGPYDSGASPNNFSWTAGTTSSPTEGIVGSDNAGNTAATTITFVNDSSATAPTVTFPANGSGYNSGGWSTINGSASDGGSGVASSQISIQDTTVGGSSCWNGTNFTASCPNWITVSGTTSWTYSALASSNLTNGHAYTLSARTTDNLTNTSSATTSNFTYDTSAPNTATLTTNGVYNSAGWGGSVQGTATDSGTGGNGISAVKVSIQKDGGANACWNGSNAFTSSCPNWVSVTSGGTATGSANANWSYTLASSALTNGSTYAVSVQATDATSNGNTSGTLSTSSFGYDTSAPNTATLTTNGVYNSAGWGGSVQGTATDSGTGGNGISAVKISIQKDGGANACWNGSNFGASCPNWVSVTSGGTASGSANANWSYTLASTALTSGSTYGVSVQATDATSNGNTSGTLSTSSFGYDTAAPNTATLTTNGSYNASGWGGAVQGTATDSGTGGNGISAVDLSIQDSVSGKCWNGTNFTTASCPNWVAVTSGGTASGSANANWSYTLASSALTDGHTYTVTVRATDAATNGNQSGSLTAGSFKYDTTAPAHAVALNSTSGAYFSSGTLYYKGDAAGTFTLKDPITDATSGPASVTYPAIATSGWTHNAETVNSGPNYTSSTYSWVASPGGNPSGYQVTGADGAGNSSTSSITFTNDVAGPTVTAPSVTGGYYNSLTVGVTPNGGTDSGSGVATGTSVVQRDSATLANGTCGSFSGTWTNVTLAGGFDTTVASGNCYEYRERLTDNVGNLGYSAASNIAKVDTGTPSNSLSLTSISGGAYKSGTTVYYRGSSAGSFKIRNAVSDSESGPASSATAALGGTTSGWTHTPSTVSTPSGGPYDSNTFSWSAGTSSSPTEVVTGADNANNTTAAGTLTFTDDSTAPTVATPTVTAGYYTSASVAVTPNGGADSGSGLASGSSNVQRDEATLSNGTCGSFPGTWTNVTLSGGADTTVQSGKCYVYRQQLTDNVGNVGSSSASNVAKIDTQAPTNSLSLSSVSPTNAALLVGTRVFYRGAAAGSFKITNAVADGESGPASSATAALGGTTSGWTHTPSTVSTPSGGPYESNAFSWSAATSSSPTEVVTAADGAGNTTAASSLTFTDDSVAPTGGALTVNGTAASGGGTTSTSTNGSFPIDVRTDYSETQSSTQSGLASSTLTRQSASLTNNACGSFGSPTPISGNPSQSLSTGCYLFTLTGTDNVGNTVSSSTTVKVDTSPPSTPSLTISNLSGNVTASGTTVSFLPTGSGSFDVTASSTDSDTGVSYTFPTAGSMGSGWSVSGSGATRTYSFTPSAAQPGTQTVTATNGVGATASDTFSVVYSDSTPPTSSIQCNGATCQAGYYTSTVSVTLSATDNSGGSGVQVIRYTTNGSDPTTVNGNDYTGAFNLNSDTTVKYRAYDVAGNAEAINSKSILVDPTPPTGPTLTVTENPASAAQHVSGTTVFYRPGGGGTFRISASTNDPQTGVTSVDFGSIANVTGGGTLTSSPYQMDYTWSAATSGSGSHNVVATNGAGATSSASFDLTADSTAPSGQTITLTGANAPYYNTASVTFSLGDGSDGSGSGIDVSTRTVTRESATLSGDSCGSFTADAGTYTSPDTSVSSGHCYRYTFTVADNVGNVSSGVTATAKVDTGAPTVNVTAPTELSGGGDQYYDAGSKTQYFRSTGSGSFALNATASDTESAVTGVAFPDVSGVSGWSGSIGGTDNTSPYSSPTNYTWTAGAAEPASRNVTATDKAGNNASDGISIKDDTTAPTGQSITLSATYFTTASVSFTLGDGTDPASGIDTSTRTVTRETGDLNNGTCSNFTADAGTFTSPDTSVSGGHCYRYTFTIKDNVGNVSSGVTATAKVDTTAPTTPTLSFGSFTNAAATGTTVYFRQGQSGGFTVSSTSSDPESGIASTSYPTLGGGWTNTGGAYSFDATAAAPSGSENVTSRNGAGADSANSPFTVVADTTAPQTTPLCNGGSCAGWFTSSPVAVTLSANDFGGSGTQVIRYTTDGTDPTLANGSDYTGAINVVGTTTVKFRAYDRVGNVETTASQTVQIDTSAPSAPSLTLSESSPYEFVSGATLYYNPNGSNSGTFTVDGTSSDVQSGIQKLTFPTLTGMTGGGDDFFGPYQGSYSWDNTATTSPGSNDVTATNNAGLTSQSSFTVTKDAAAPTGQALTLTGAGAPYYKTASVTFSLGDGSDSGSGLDASSETVTRETATLSGDGCSTFTGDPGTFTSPDTSVSGGHCYRYTFTIKDNVGNVSSGVTATAKVDTTAPTVNVTAPTELSGAGDQYYNSSTKTQYFRSTASGSFALNATATDGDTAVTAVAFPDVSATSGWSGSIGGNDNSSPYSSPTNYTWTAGAAEPAAQTVIGTDKAANAGSDTITIKNDTSAPTGQTITLSSTYFTSTSVSFTLGDGTDADSGIDIASRSVTRETGTLSNGVCSGFSADGGTFTSPDTSVSGGHCYRYTFTIKDNVGNVSTPVTATAKLDATAPALTLNAPTELSGPGNQYYDGLTQTQWFRPSGSGSFALNATSSDAESTVTGVDFPDVSGVSGWSGSTGGTDPTSPYSSPTTYSWTSGAAAPGARNVVATNGAGLTTTGTVTLAADAAGPTGQTIALTGAGAPYYKNTSVTFTLGDGSDAASGLDTSTRTVTRETAPLSGDSCGTFTADAGTFTSPDTSVTGGHCYRYTFTIADNVGNVSAGVSATAKVDTAAPTAAATAPTELTGAGNQYFDAPSKTQFFRSSGSGSFRLNATASDAHTAVASVAFPDVSGTSGWSGSTGGTDTTGPYSSPATYTWSAGAGEPGTQTLTATDLAGNTGTDGIAIKDDTTAPSGQTITLSSPYFTTASVTFSLTDGSDNVGGSGLDTSSRTVTRETGTLSGDTCSGFAADAGTFTSPDTAVSNGHCYRYTFTQADNVGNVTAGVTATAKVDTASPTASLTNPGTPLRATVTLNATASDGETAVQQVSFQRSPAGANTWTTIGTDNSAPFSASWDTTAVTDGLYDLRAVATDSAGNTGTSTVVTNRRVDNTAPDTTIDSKPSDPSNNPTPTFQFSSNETGSTFECRIDGGSWSSCSSPDTLSTLANGSHTFDVRAIDAAGNTDPSPATYTWTVDFNPPDTTIDSQPGSPSSNASPTFTFSATIAGSTFECRVDGGSWAACTSPKTIGPLAAGSHTFNVRATSPAGNTDPSPASYTWTIDLSAPSVTITAPTAYVNASDPSNYPMTATTPDGDVTKIDFYECSNSSSACSTGAWNLIATDNTAPYGALWSTPASDGTKAIRAVATDTAGNTGADVRTITIDRTAPSGVTISYPNGYASGAVAIATGNGPDSDVNASSGTIERALAFLTNDTCGVYGGYAPVTSPDTVPSGECAKYLYHVADNAGNVTTVNGTNVVKRDAAAPTSSLADPGTNLRLTISLSASASDTGGAGLASVTFERKPSGGGSWTAIATDTTAPYSTSFDTTTVSDGLYDFRAVASDVAGNVETSPVAVTNRRIDNTPPSATMLSPGNPVRATVTLTSTTNDGGSGVASVSYEIAPSGGSFSSQSATWNTTLIADGLYDLRVVATDNAGNTATSTKITTRVDNTPPSVFFTSPASGANVRGTVSLVATASDASPASPAVSFEYKLHSAPASAYVSTPASWNTTTLPAGDGLYDLRATATDDANNVTRVENTSIVVDNVAPTVSITAPSTTINASVASPTTFSANASDSGSGVQQVEFFECSNASVDCSTGVFNSLGVDTSAPFATSWNIAPDGNETLKVTATDNAGHTTSATRNVTIDTNPPFTNITGAPGDPSSVSTFTFTSSEAGSTFQCRVDGGSWNACTSPYTFSGLSDNQHTAEIRSIDPAGNVDPTPPSWTWHRDTTNPTGTLNSPGANIRGSVVLTSTVSDPSSNGYASGVNAVAYQYSADGSTWATIGIANSAPFTNMTWNTTGVSDGVYQLRIVIGDVAGNVGTSSVVTNVRVDNTPPTTSQDDPGTYLRATKTLTGSAADSGSGIDHVDFQRSPAGANTWTTIGTDTTAPFSTAFDTSTVADGHYDFRTVAVDVAGNSTNGTPVNDRLVDNTPPNAVMNDPSTAAGFVRGTINLTSAPGTTDPGGANASGVASVAYEYSTNGGSTWTPTGTSLNTTSLADGSLKLHVIATDNAGNTATSAAVTDTIDNTRPVTTDNAPSGYQASPVTVTLSATDAGSGVNITEYSVDGGPYFAGSSVTIPAPADGSNDGAHTIAYFSADNVGNVEQVKSTTVLIDATPPVCPSCSAADYLRGTVTLSASPVDGGGGIKSVTFQYAPAGGSTWTTIGTDTTGPAPYTASWNTTTVADGHYDIRIRVTDNADNTTTTNMPDKVVDNTPPNVATVGSPTQGAIVSGNVGITASAADVTSPVASVEFIVRGTSIATDTTAPYSQTWDSTTVPDGTTPIQVIVTDMAGNTTASPVRTITVDNHAPAPTLDDPGANLRATATLTASSDPDTVQVEFQRMPAGGSTWTTITSDASAPFSASFDTTPLSDGLYDFRVIATDSSGNTGTSAVRSNVRIDNTSPTGSVSSPANGATVGGTSVPLGVTASDGGSGVGSVRYERRPTGGSTWTTITTSTSSPFGGTWDTTGLASGNYDLRAVVTDNAGNTFTSATITVNVDASAPTVTLADPGSSLSGTVTLSATVGGTGATQVEFSASAAGANAWKPIATDTSSPYGVSFDTTKFDDGLYDVRAVVSDSLGNTSQSVRTGIRVDNTAPRLVSSTPADGSRVESASSIELVASEAATASAVTLDGAGTVTPVVTGTHLLYNTGPLGNGLHVLAGTLADASGKSAPFRIAFTVGAAGTTAPVERSTSSSSATSITSADGFATLTVPAGAWAPRGNDWIVIRIDTRPAAGAANGFVGATEIVDVTAFWALSGEQVHHFDQPLELYLRSTEAGIVPATFDGNWLVLRRMTGTTLPATWDDGFFRDGGGYHLLTRHLSQFTLLRDVQPPSAPTNVLGFFSGGRLTLSWTPGADNSGTYDFVRIFADGHSAGEHSPGDTRADVGPWTPTDTRSFTLRETDLAGNESVDTKALRPVPAIVGLNRDAAVNALVDAGFTIGDVTEGGTGAPGTVTGPANLVLAEQGAAINIAVAPGSGATKFAFAVLSTKTARRMIAARLSLTRAATVSTALYGPRGMKLAAWKLKVRAGRTNVKLRIPSQVRRAGLYSLKWTATSAGARVTRTTHFRLVTRSVTRRR